MCICGRFIISATAFVVALVFTAKVAVAQDPLENAPLAAESAARGKVSENDPTTSRASETKAESKSKASAKPEFVMKSPAEWRKILTKTQFAVARQKMTEPAFSGKYASGHFSGTFVCVCCDAAHVQSELFSSKAKFESGTGWPSFFQAYNNKSLQTAWDYGDAEPRVEVMCRRCGAHLGHVFDDGPPPTGLRFCINSESIKLVSPEGNSSSKSAAAKKTTTSVKSKARHKAGAKSAPKDAEAKESAEPSDPQSAPAADKPATDPPRRDSAT